MAFLAGGSSWPVMGSVDESALEEQIQPGRSESVAEQNIDCTGVQMREREREECGGRKTETFTQDTCR